MKHYYDTINAAAAGIADHHEKQKFLKVVYETFYKSYNPSAADRLGVVYTPNEIVWFMVESTDYLLYKHFNVFLHDKGVDILDPATGTGTFICDIIDYLRKDKVEKKYKEELHANEVAILPYYISNLNIEYTYKQKTGTYKEFTNLCFADTLDNILGLDEALIGIDNGKYKKTGDLFAISTENSGRINRQNEKKISVVIGNPPYNANQMNENENNKNREYPFIDKRIKDTFIKNSTAQKTKVYDMYARFYRWAMDRLNGDGVIALVTNRSFIDSRTFDGFRKCIQDSFDFAYIIDTKSDVRANPKIAGTTHNVFGIQTGVAIMFLIKTTKKESIACNIQYIPMDDFWRKEVKLQWLSEHHIKNIPFDSIRPDHNNNWLDIADTDFDTLLPLIDKNVKLGRSTKSVFELYSLGAVTNRDEWVYGYSKTEVKKKVQFFIKEYNNALKTYHKTYRPYENMKFENTIKWTRAVKKDFVERKKYKYDDSLIIDCLYRPFCKKKLYYSADLNEMRYQMPLIFPETGKENRIIAINQGTKPFNVLVSKFLVDLHFNGDSNCLPLYKYEKGGKRIDNITDWGLKQFCKHYNCYAKGDVPINSKLAIGETMPYNKDEFSQPHLSSNEDQLLHEPEQFYGRIISKEDIFHYTYAVLHNPAYCKKYELNLKREFPRLPFYDDFFKWAAWGKKLMDLHLGFEQVKPYPLEEIVSVVSENPKAKLKAVKTVNNIEIDENSTLSNVPTEAWGYMLGNRCAIDWVLDQYKESKPKDPIIEASFDTYNFADYKPEVIDLIKKVCTVSIETMKIIGEMGKEEK